MTLEAAWWRSAPLLAPALDGSHAPEDVWAGVKSGAFHLWPGEAAAAVCELVQHPRRRDYHVWLAGGSLRELIEMERAAEAFARTAGCDRLTVLGRRGWARALPGYRVEHVALTKELK